MRRAHGEQLELEAQIRAAELEARREIARTGGELDANGTLGATTLTAGELSPPSTAELEELAQASDTVDPGASLATAGPNDGTLRTPKVIRSLKSGQR